MISCTMSCRHVLVAVLNERGSRSMLSGYPQIIWSHSQVMWARAPRCPQPIRSRKSGCSRSRRFMFSGRYTYLDVLAQTACGGDQGKFDRFLSAVDRVKTELTEEAD